MTSIYTPHTCCERAYQLNWSYSLFWRDEVVPDRDWLAQLVQACEKDHIRVLEHRAASSTVSQFLISTRPDLSPVTLLQRVKGRLQYVLQPIGRKLFRRNYGLRSIGSTKRTVLEDYLETQLDHHPVADPLIDDMLRKYQIHNPQVDLSRPQHTDHGTYWYNLHVVLVNDRRQRESSESYFARLNESVRRTAATNKHQLSRAALIPDHLHLALGCTLLETPEQIVLSYMNSISQDLGMGHVFSDSYFVGTFSEYDLGVIPLVQNHSLR